MNLRSIQEMVVSSFNRWVSLCKQGEHDLAKGEAQKTIDLCIEAIRSENVVDCDAKKWALCSAILFRGLQDFNTTHDIINSSDSKLGFSQVEDVWTLLWDCNERIEFSRRAFSSRVLEHLLERIRYLTDFIDKAVTDKYGPAVYTSPEVISSAICSICLKDPRVCDHLNGQIYAGHLCTMIPTDIRLVNVARVKTPKDPVNRLWPWRSRKDEQGDTVYEGCVVLRAFRLDDFMEK
ncbi:MAG: hypothetical protein ACXV3D_03415 [Halobacteriota archaeon]